MSNTNMCLQQKKMEMFTGEFLKQEGYVTKVLLSEGNLGVDMFAEKNGKLCALQVKLCDDCKTPISPEMLMELFGAMHYYGSQEAMFVYNGYINDEVTNVARKLGIQLIYFDPLQYVNSSSEDTTDSSLSGSAINSANELEVNITLNGYKRYYGSLEFQRDLMRYFNVSRGILAAHIHGLVMSVLGLIRPGEKAVRHPLVRTTSTSPSACSSTISRPKAFLCSLAET